MLSLISTIFKTINSSVDDTRKTLALFNKDWNTYKTNWQNANGFWGKVGSVFAPSKSTSVTPQQLQILKNWNNAVKHGCTNQETFNRIIADADDKTKLYFAGLNKGKGSVEGLKNAQNVAKASTIGLTIAQTALNAAISMGIGILINLAITGITKLVNANKEAIESANELREKYADFKETNASNISTLKGLKDEFTELSKGVSQYGDNISLTTEQYDRYREIIQQIVGISPSLSEGYSTENGHIADKNGLLERAIELQEIEYKNELRKITNLDNLKTSMSGYIAEYKEALNGGILTAEGNIVGTTIDTDFKNSLWQLFNTNNREGFNAEDMAKQIMESLGVADVEKELKKYYNEYGYWQDGWFWNDYANTIAGNLDAVTGSLTYEDVGLDEDTFDQNLEKLESYSESYGDMLDSVKLANEAIQTDLGYIAEYADGYSDLSTEQQKFVADFLKGFDINDIASENAMGTLSYDNDKMASVKSQINKFVEELSKDTVTKDALSKLYAIPTDSQSVGDFVSQFRSALDTVRDYCEENGIEIPLGISESETEINELEAQYNRVVEYVKGKFDGYDFSDFFKTKSINSKEELDKFLEIAQGANTATEAMEKYVQSSTSLNKMTASLENLNKEIDAIQSAYQAVESAIEEFNTTGSLSVDTYQTLTELEAKYIPYLIDEQGNLTLTKDALNELTAARIREAAVKQAEDYIDYIAGLGSEKAQIDAVTASVNNETNAINSRITAKLKEKVLDGAISQNVAKQMVGHIGGIIGMAESAISGLDTGGLSKNAADNAKKASEYKQDLAEKEADLREQLAEKEADFKEKMEEAQKKERIESFKEELEQRLNLLKVYESRLSANDFGVDVIDEKDTDTKKTLLDEKLQTSMEYSQKLKSEFDHLASLTPQYAEEAQAVADAIEDIGSKLRDNVVTIRETAVALEQVKISQISDWASNQVEALEHEVERIDSLLNILKSEDPIAGKYTEDLLYADIVFKSLTSSDDKLKARQAEDKKLIDEEKKHQQEINKIVNDAANKQIAENKKAREKERQELIKDMEKTRADIQKQLKKAQDDYNKKMDELNKKTSDTTSAMETSFNTSVGSMQDKVDNFSTQNIIDEFDKVVLAAKAAQDAIQKINLENSHSISKGGDLLKAASKYIGQRNNSSNGFKFSDGRNEAWCADFVSYVAKEVGITTLPQSASVEVFYNYFKKNGKLTTTPSVGSIVMFNWKDKNGTIYDHIGIVERYDDDNIYTIEGNTSDGKVDRKTRSRHSGNILGYGAYAGGTDNSKGGLAWLGEEGYEIVKTPDGQIHVVGLNGFELADLPEGSVVLNHEESKEILENPTKLDALKTTHESDLKGKNDWIINKHKTQTKDVNTQYLTKLESYFANKDTMTPEEKEKELGSLRDWLTEQLGNIGKTTGLEIIKAYNNWNKAVLEGAAVYDSEVEDAFKEAWDEALSTAQNAEDLEREKHEEYLDSLLEDIEEADENFNYKIQTDESFGRLGIDDKINNQIESIRRKSADISKIRSDEKLSDKEKENIIKNLEKELTDEQIKLYDLEKQKLEETIEEKARKEEELLQFKKDMGEATALDELNTQKTILNNYGAFIEKIKQDDTLGFEHKKELLEKYSKLYQDTLGNIYKSSNNVLNETLSETERYISRINKKRQEDIEILDKQISRENALLSIKKKSFDATNSLLDARHEADKAIAESRIGVAYLNESEYSRIYNEEDYALEVAKISEIQEFIDSTTRNFYASIEDLREDELYLVEAMTEEYNRQIEAKERELEIVKSEINLQKKQDELNNILADKNVRMLKDGHWVWTFNLDNAKQAQQALDDAKYALSKAKRENKQQDWLDGQQRNISDLELEKTTIQNEMSLVDEAIEDLKLAIEDITDPIRNIGSLADMLATQGIGKLNVAFNDILSMLSAITGENYGVIGTKKFVTYNGRSYEEGTLGYNHIVKRGLVEPKVSAKGDYASGYVTGADSAEYIAETNTTIFKKGNEYIVKKGNHTGSSVGNGVPEDFEIPTYKTEEKKSYTPMITEDGVLIPIDYSTYSIPDISSLHVDHMTPLSSLFSAINLTPDLLTNKTREEMVQNLNFYGGINVYEPADFNGFMVELTSKAGAQAAITNKTK